MSRIAAVGWGILAVIVINVFGILAMSETEPSGPRLRHMVARSYISGQTLYEGDIDVASFRWSFAGVEWKDSRGAEHNALWDGDKVSVEFHPLAADMLARQAP